MTRNIHALRMFIWLAAKESTANTFYEGVLGLPLVRRIGDHGADIWWAGEATVFEAIYVAGKQPEPNATPSSGAWSPVFRVSRIDALVERLSRAGARATAVTVRGASREAWLQDSDGHWTGLRERAADASLPQDAEARRRASRGEAFNPGCKSMPDGIREIGWVVRNVRNLAGMCNFYEQALGLQRMGEDGGRVLYDIGDNVILELAPDGDEHPAPKDRHDASSICLLRAADVPALQRGIAAHGGHIVNERIPIHWASLSYCADPEGGLFGIEQDLHPGSYAPEKFVLPEVLEAERRWRESSATATAA